ncbi:MAG: hypothetical protein M3X11_22110 [Acidobacteriota bacterium]|nr:hypothetical protein [Acidobacteriota bacterium]
MWRDLATPPEWSPRGLHYFLRPRETSVCPRGAERVSSGAALVRFLTNAKVRLPALATLHEITCPLVYEPMKNPNLSRREFVVTSAASVLLTAASANKVLGANNRLRVGIIGCGGLAQGSHIPALLRMKETDNVEIAAV